MDDSSSPPATEPRIGFALGGLAGNNFHGAGFLQAALTRKFRPTLITCTSGQIRWVHRYLSALASHDPAESFAQDYQKELAISRPTQNPNIDLARLMTGGFPGVFRPAWDHWCVDIMRNGFAANLDAWRQWSQGQKPLAADMLLALSTNRLSVPLLEKATLEALADLFNNGAHGIGIAFNSYDPVQGVEHVYMNEAAFKVTGKRPETCHQARSVRKASRSYRIYRRITAAGLEAALWLYAYGFEGPRATAGDDDGAEGSTASHIDGAFFREVMLAELGATDLVFAVRPVHHQWKGDLPRTYPGTEDMKTDVGFNGSYSAERDQVLLINKLLANGLINTDSPKGQALHQVKLCELEPEQPRGYFDYALESDTVFTDSREQALAAFADLRLP